MEKEKIMAGRVAITTYREAHRQLYITGWHKGINEEHTPLLNTLLDNLAEPGFSSLGDFFIANEDFNAKALGFASKKDFNSQIDELNKDAKHYTIIGLHGEEIEMIESTPEAKELYDNFKQRWH